MKTLVIGNFKGGVGKSFVAVQLAYHFALNMDLRTCLIDLDAQQNSTNILLNNKVYGKPSDVPSVDFFRQGKAAAERIAKGRQQCIQVVEATEDLGDLLRTPEDKYPEVWTNFFQAVKALQDKFDVVVIDTAPAIDLRLWGAILAGDFILNPIELKEESIDGIANISSTITNTNKMPIGFDHYCHQLGLLINRFQKNSQQKKNFLKLSQSVGGLLFTDPEGVPYTIAESKIYSLAQEQALPVWKVQADNIEPGRTRIASSTTPAWKKLQPVWTQVAVKMRLLSNNVAVEAEMNRQAAPVTAPAAAPKPAQKEELVPSTKEEAEAQLQAKCKEAKALVKDLQDKIADPNLDPAEQKKIPEVLSRIRKLQLEVQAARKQVAKFSQQA